MDYRMNYATSMPLQNHLNGYNEQRSINPDDYQRIETSSDAHPVLSCKAFNIDAEHEEMTNRKCYRRDRGRGGFHWICYGI